MKKNPFGVLTSFQTRVLDALVQETPLKDFYLTGGTALSAFYLGHRLSEDLDLFTEVPQGIARIPPLMRKIARKLKLRLVLGRRFQTLFECALINRAGERLEMDFALDMPGRLAPLKKPPDWGLRIDNRLDIACNKLSALYERSEPKDFVDLYVIHQSYLPFPKLIQQARKKYPELDNYGLAMAFFKVKGIELWPKMLRPINQDQLQDFFLTQAKRYTTRFS